MFGQLFGKYLVKENILDEETLNKILSAQLQIRVKLGVIAVADKLLTTEQADEINRIQQQEDKRFGDIAIEKGWLTDAQISELLENRVIHICSFYRSLLKTAALRYLRLMDILMISRKNLDLMMNRWLHLKRMMLMAL